VSMKDLSVPYIIRELDNDKSRNHLTFMRFVDDIKDQRLADALRGFIERDEITHPGVISELLSYLGRSKDKKAIPLFLKYLKSDNSSHRYNAVEALGNIVVFPTDEILNEVISVLDDEYDLTRSYAAETLGKMGDERAIPALRDAFLKEKEDYTKSTISSALELLGWSPQKVEK